MRTIKIYNTDIFPSKNMQIENVATYLATLSPLFTFEEVNKIRVDLDINVKLPIEQSVINTTNANYLEYNEDDFTYYFFIMKISQVNSKTVELMLSLDTINTYQNYFDFDKKTNIIREHCDRFYNSNDIIGVEKMDFSESKCVNSEINADFNNTTITLSGTSSKPYFLETITTLPVSKGEFYLTLENNENKYLVIGFKDTLGGDINWYVASKTEAINITTNTGTIIFALDIPLEEEPITLNETITVSIKKVASDSVAYLRKFDKQKEGIDSTFKVDSYEKLGKTTGKNLFDGEWEEGDINRKTGIPIIYNDRMRTKNFIKVKPQTAYIFTMPNFENGDTAYFYYDINKNFISVFDPKGQLPFVTPNNCEYIKVIVANTNDINQQCQLELGTTATDYEPYHKYYNKWYIAYETNTELSTSNLNNPVTCKLFPSEDIKALLPANSPYELNIGEMFTSIITSAVENVYFTSGELKVTANNREYTFIIGTTVISTTFDILDETPIANGTIAKVNMQHPVSINNFILSFLDSDNNVLWTDVIAGEDKYLVANNIWTVYNSESFFYSLAKDGSTTTREIALLINEEASVITVPALDKSNDIFFNSRTMKIITVPYSPIPLQNDTYNNETYYYFENTFTPSPYGYFESEVVPDFLNKNAVTFEFSPFYATIPFEKGIARNDYYESKLFTKEFYNAKLSYDNFEVLLNVEDVDPDNNDKKILVEDINKTYTVEEKVTSTINSTFILKSNAPVNIKYASLFENYLMVKRNNELPIYSNTYIDYIRNGYRYDIKSIQLQQKQSWISTGINIAGSGISAITSIASGNAISGAAAVSLGASAINSISNNIMQKTINNNNIENKLATLKAQASTVSANDNIDLMEYYNDNKAIFSIEKPIDEIINAVADLFYYCGYAKMKQGIPDISSRKYFNYLQADVVFKNESTRIFAKYIEDIKARFSAGVTIFHYVNGTYDLEQALENWEVFIDA